MLQSQPAEFHRPLARELDARLRELLKQILDDVYLIPQLSKPGPCLVLMEAARDTRKICFELDGVIDAGRLLPPRAWLPTFQSVPEDLVDLLARHGSELAALVAIPRRIGLFELPAFGFRQLALRLNVVEMLRDHEAECGGFAETALLRETPQALSERGGHPKVHWRCG